MSERPPPNPNVGEFNNAYWLYFDDVLNVNQLDTRYLKFPTSQGSETINGALDVLGLTTVSASGIRFSDGTLQTTAGGASSNPTLAQTLLAGNSAGSTNINMNSREITNTLNITTQNMTSTGIINSSNITNSNTISTLDLTVSGTTTAGNIIGSDLVSKDATADATITNKLSSFTYFDKNIALMRTANVYRKFWIGMTGDNVNPTNRFAIGCNAVNPAEPEILMEIDATGEISMRNGLKIFDLQGNNIGTINNFSDSSVPPNSTFSIRTNGNLFLESGGTNVDPTLSRFIDAWSPTLKLGQIGGSTLQMRTDLSNTYRSRITLKDLTLFGGLGNGVNDASIELNGETQNKAYTDADHAEVAKIPTIENAVGTNTGNISTNTGNITTLNSSITSLNTSVNSLSTAFKGASYRMPFNVFKTTNGQTSVASAGHALCFTIQISPGYSRNDLIYLKVCMRHYTTFNYASSPFTMLSSHRGYYDGIWIFNPKECSAQVRWSTTPISNPSNTGNPISGGTGYGPDALDTSSSINSSGHLFYRESGNIVNGNWGGSVSNNTYCTLYMVVNAFGVCTIDFRYLPITDTGLTPSTRNQNISGTVEIISAETTAVGGEISLITYNSNGGLTFNSNHDISSQGPP
jgi:hypothetical protein